MFYFMLVRAVMLCVEVIVLLVQRGRHSDVLTNIVCGVAIYINMKLWQNALVFAAMIWISQHALFDLDSTWWLFFIAIPLADLTYYIYHYSAHKIRFFWADHSIHHSSKEFDLTTNLRHSFFSGLYSWWPSIPFLLFGFPPLLFVWARALVNDYTFFVHTARVGKLGWLEKVLNTPSHHRVHHSKNPEYLDKNFGFMFIVWDKLFGTFAEEKAPCHYGINIGPETRNPVKVVFFEWRRLYLCFLAQVGLRAKILSLIKMDSHS